MPYFVGLVSRMYEDASDFMSATVCAGLVEFRERHDKRTDGQHYTAADRPQADQ